MNQNIVTILTLVLLAGVSRLIPHPWNFTAIGAMALFSGNRMPHKTIAFIAPLLTLLWTDAILGFHITMVYVYAAVALTTLIGFWTQGSIRKILMGSLSGSILFFVITNFGVWYSQGMYPLTLSGLEQCFIMAIPFFHYQLLGDLFYSGVLFGLHFYVKSWQESRQVTSA